MTDAVPLHVTVDVDGDRVVLVLSGEIDLLSRPSLADLLDAAMDGVFPRVEVDMAKVSFINATGLRVLCQGYHLGAQRGVALTVRRPSPHLVSLLRRIDPTALLLGNHAPAPADSDAESSPAGPPQPCPGETRDARDRRADERDRIADERDRRADEREREIGEREERAADLQLLNDERDRLLDERQLSILRHEQWGDIREDMANAREVELDQRERDC